MIKGGLSSTSADTSASLPYELQSAQLASLRWALSRTQPWTAFSREQETPAPRQAERCRRSDRGRSAPQARPQPRLR